MHPKRPIDIRVDAVNDARRRPFGYSHLKRVSRMEAVVAEQVPAVSNVLDAIERRDWGRLRALLHAEVHWTTAAEDELRGPEQVLSRLGRDPPPAPPSYHELRDGLVLRWIDCPG